MIWICFIPVVLLLLGLADLPIGYYTLLRIVVCLSACIITCVNYDRQKKINFGAVYFGIIALLFNPIIPIYLREKDVWAVIDIIAAISFMIVYLFLRKKEKIQQ